MQESPHQQEAMRVKYMRSTFAVPWRRKHLKNPQRILVLLRSSTMVVVVRLSFK